jgi:predicted DNA-binding transcriptional regulator AlpA
MRISNKGRLLRLPEVLEILPISRTTFYAGITLGIYAPPVRLGKRTVAWWENDLIVERKRAGSP